MPELPEVEVVRRGLMPLVGARVDWVEVLDARAITRHAGGAADFEARLTGAVLWEPARRGKFLWLPLDPLDPLGLLDLPDPRDPLGPPDPLDSPVEPVEAASASAAGLDRLDQRSALLIHLGMSGQLRLDDERTPHRHERVRIGVGERVLAFLDQRTFGSLAVDRLVPVAEPAEAATPARAASAGSAGRRLVPSQVAHIARDPLDPAFDDRAFIRRLRAKRTEVKRALLDQTLVSGIGNIYADEALWGARIHPRQPTERLSGPAAARLLGEVRLVMERALAEGGTSFDALYVNVNGESGYFSRSLRAYAQDGEPCGRCGTPLVREAFANRGSHFCPRCQRLR